MLAFRAWRAGVCESVSLRCGVRRARMRGAECTPKVLHECVRVTGTARTAVSEDDLRPFAACAPCACCVIAHISK